METWFHFVEHTSRVIGQVEELMKFVSERKVPDYTHPEKAKATRHRDVAAIGGITKHLLAAKLSDPNRDPQELVSTGSGLKDRSGTCNPETAREFGEKCLAELDGKPYLVSILRAKWVPSLSTLKPCVKVGNRSIRSDQCGTLDLINRLILIGDRYMSIELCLEFELTQYPLSLFDEDGVMRDRNKSELGRAFKSRLSEDDSGTVSWPGRVVVDGGWMLYQVDWKSCTTYGDLADKFVPLIQGLSKGCEKVLVIFDCYQSSPKNHEHLHCHNLSCAELKVKHDSKIPVDRIRFVSNGRNKEALIQLLM